ncbi:MAG: hypothetical protein AAF927_19545 [Bacteroidota bacterium]
MKSSSFLNLRIPLSGLFFLIILSSVLKAQNESEELSDWERTFMPAVQMGYVAHGTAELSSGLMVQTSMEYRDISNFIFRINYDDFNSNMNLRYPINEDISFTGRTSFSELIVGVGYRKQMEKHNLTAYVQPGLRFYGYPIFEENNTQVNLNLDSRRIGMIRYSLGYEYAIAPRFFFTIEFLASHVLKAVDFWTDNRWSYGATMGFSAPLF